MRGCPGVSYLSKRLGLPLARGISLRALLSHLTQAPLPSFCAVSRKRRPRHNTSKMDVEMDLDYDASAPADLASQQPAQVRSLVRLHLSQFAIGG